MFRHRRSCLRSSVAPTTTLARVSSAPQLLCYKVYCVRPWNNKKTHPIINKQHGGILRRVGTHRPSLQQKKNVPPLTLEFWGDQGGKTNGMEDRQDTADHKPLCCGGNADGTRAHKRGDADSREGSAAFARKMFCITRVTRETRLEEWGKNLFWCACTFTTTYLLAYVCPYIQRRRVGTEAVGAKRCWVLNIEVGTRSLLDLCKHQNVLRYLDPGQWLLLILLFPPSYDTILAHTA